MFPAKSFSGKKVAVFGLARSGISCATALNLGDAEVFAWDDSDPAVEKAKAEGLSITNLHNVDFKTLDALVLSPGVPLTHPAPHWTVIKAQQAGIEIIGDTEIFARELNAAGSKLVAITGTNGKSTTTALTGHVLKSAGLDVDVGGNIGLAVFNLREPAPGRIYVLELSSFQIDLMPSLKPDVGILTNITADHLDRHGTIENYAAVKARMFDQMKDNDLALISVDDEFSAAIAAHVEQHHFAMPVSVKQDLIHGFSAPEGVLHHRYQGELFAEIDLRAMPALKGHHNWQNACMAYGSAIAMGVSREQIEAAMQSFPGLAHRMQQIGQAGNVAFINDSKATNADAAEKALGSFENIYWIAGGIAKAGGIEPLESFFPRIKRAYLIGAAAPDFAKTLEGKVDFVISETLDHAVAQAAHDAEGDAPVVLFSPACASFDQYKNFEVRGDAFVSEVAKLPGIHMIQGDAP
ncbi:UDP-N-acetylmuramoyl-L-alanine--D-glutamate ligase [Aestuariivirga litoralis]|uniref:UDP-N-acetylmuramoyl-L-alanine--D-glutamate ligase n=1 Tax=Aestuariivirga litoralis TaxID=2650924 RepID=UPI0018C4B5AF|nr:UDP-N-acetylmuramoyl-L-alanine--D-glutamate ligase [Aestuariivirga litoralis]MBG1231957.1 UDP-N-acetylmuramoyl-L-alanine--D-glutamate ligase [Aestuariivirga litoralis]